MLKPLLALALLLPAITHARIGETPEECAKRYGDLAESRGSAASAIRIFTKAGVTTTCYFSEGICVAITFDLIVPSRTEHGEGPVNTSVTFTKAQMFNLLDANKGNSEWSITPKGRDVYLFTTKDNTRSAISMPTQITIQTSANLDARKKLAAEEAVDSAIKDF